MTVSCDIFGAMRPAQGETVCGDAYWVVRGRVSTIALADGLGHGHGAAEAASVFIDFFTRNAAEPLDKILSSSTGPMSKTRGAVGALTRIDHERHTLEFCGVGNIEIKARSHAAINAFCMPGIIGRPVRRLNIFSFEVHPGDVLAVYSDGISSRFDLSDYTDIAPEGLAERILTDHGKNHDDATCVVLEVRSDDSAKR
jgi:negative regulator of sigma-B (phosphoserine phosphatase)